MRQAARQRSLSSPPHIYSDAFAMAHRHSRLLLGLSLCALVLLAGCDGDQTETPPPITEQPAPADTATADVMTMEESATPDTSPEPETPSEPDAQPASTTGTAAPKGELHADFEGTTEAVEGSPSGASAGTLERVRTARHADFDRIVFEFSDGGVPAYQLNYIKGPLYRCGTGGLVDLPGEAMLAVEMNPAEPTTAEDLLAVANVSRIANLPVIEEHALVCDEDGHISWILGLNTPSRYRAFTLTNPSRLVVDLRHTS